MPSMSRLFKPLADAANAFFRHDVALKRHDGAVQVVLQPPAEPRKSPREKRAEESARKDKAEIDLARAQLTALLDEVPGTRSALRHLVFVEKALLKKGFRVLHKLPLPVLQKGLEQLEGVVTNWSPEGLANLRSKMAVAILDREHMGSDAEADAYRTTGLLECEAEAALPDPKETVEEDESAVLAAAYAALGAMSPDSAAGELTTSLGAAAFEPTPLDGGAHAAPAVAHAAPAAAEASVELQSDLGTPSARALARQQQRRATQPAGNAAHNAGELQLRELQP